MIFFLLDCEYLPTVLHGGEGPKFQLSEQVIKSESGLLFEHLGHQDLTIQLRLLNDTPANILSLSATIGLVLLSSFA